jgi:hypothetical protein
MSTIAREVLGTGTLLIGNDAGWLLSFHRQDSDPDGFLGFTEEPVLEIGRDEYYAQINASLPGGLEGGVYSFVIEGLTETHYRTLKAEPRLVVKLFLYWRDTNASLAGYVKNVAGLTDVTAEVRARDIPDSLVAVLTVVSVSRRAGTRLYETTVTARERVFEILNNRRMCGKAIEAPAEQALSQLLLDRIKLREFQFHGVSPHPEEKYVPSVQGKESEGKRSLKPGRGAIQLLREIGNRLEQRTGRYGRGMFLIRDGVLHIGTRSIPLRSPAAPGATPPSGAEGLKPLHAGNGLIELEPLESLPKDPNFDACAAQQGATFSEEGSTQRRHFKLTLKGRPDLKPGDAVIFDVPREENGEAGPGVSTSAVQLYVSSVEHRLSRTGGFVTTASGAEFTSEEDQWDGHTPLDEEAGSLKSISDVNPATSAGKAVQRLVQSQLDGKRFAEICEVRAATSRGAKDPPSQTVDLTRGLEAGDGNPNQARRLAIDRRHGERASGIPYATPFAWGKCGLVLPRYPGMRVVTVYRQGRSDDAIDAGALWESGHGPDSQPGDWWLILPIGVPAQKRAASAEDEVPAEHRGKVSQDLIDADGRRVIEVGQLSVIVLPPEKLRDAGQRPEHGTHVPGGASIIVRPDGSVVIRAQRIEFDAGEGDITMKARNVNVNVAGSMDVS